MMGVMADDRRLAPWLIAVAMLACAVVALLQWRAGHRLVTGTVDAEPRQTGIAEPKPFAFRDLQLTPRAAYRIEAKLLSKEAYSAGDAGKLAPWDFAMGWGPMSREDVVARLGIEQSSRYYTYRWSGEPPIPVAQIVRHSANMHLIPANARIAAQLKSAQPGYKVLLEGRLVDAAWADGRRWQTSLTREDTGGGACELMFVEAVAVSHP